MGAVKKQVDKTALRQLVPLGAMPAANLEVLTQQTVLEDAPSGYFLFREGDHDNKAVYLLTGKVILKAGNKVVDTITGGTDPARYPIAHHVPRQVTAVAKSKVTYVRIDPQLLDVLLIGENDTEYQVSEIQDEDDSDWMTQLLKSQLFANLPPANIQALFAHLEPVDMKAGDVVIRQDEPGDYYYLIRHGRCRVTRLSADNSEDVTLAELSTGDGFGEEALISDARRNATITMITDGGLMRLAKSDFNELMTKPLLNWVDAQRAALMVQAGAVWLDVRLPSEHQASTMPGSVNLPLSTLRRQTAQLDAQRKYITFCDDGRRSAIAAFVLAQHGFDAYALGGGYRAMLAGATRQADSVPPSESARRQEAEVIELHAHHAATPLQVEPDSGAAAPSALERAAAGRQLEEEARRRRQAEEEVARLKAEQVVAVQRAEQEARRRQRVEEEAAQLKQEAEEARRAAEAQATRLQHERQTVKANAQLIMQRLKQERDAVRRKALDDSARIDQEHQQALAAAEQEALRLRREAEQAKQAAEAEAERLKAEQLAVRARAEEEAARLKAEAESARRQAAVEANELRAEAEAARCRAEEEAARLTAEAQAARLRAEQEAARVRAERAAAERQAEEEAAHLRAEAESARARAEQEAERLKAEAESARRRAEEEVARVRADAESALREAQQQADRLQREAEVVRERAEMEGTQRSADQAAALMGEAEAARARAEEQAASLLAEAEQTRALAYAEAEAAKHAAEQEAVRLRQAQEQALRSAEQEAVRLKAEAEAIREKAEDEARRRSQEQAALIMAEAEAAKLQAEQEAARLLAEVEEARVNALAEETKFKAAQEEIRLQAEEDMARLQAEAEAMRLRTEEEARRLTEAEANRLRADEGAARMKAEAEATRLRADEEAARLRVEAEAVRLRASEDAEQLKAEAEQARIRAEDEAARLRVEAEEARVRAVNEEARIADVVQLETQAKAAQQEAQEAEHLAAEAEQARARAEEDAQRLLVEAEAARRRAEDEVGQLRAEAEELRRRAEEDAGRLRHEAQTERQLAEEEAARLRAESEAARQKAEEETVRIKARAEAARVKAQNAIEKLRAQAAQARQRAERVSVPAADSLAAGAAAEPGRAAASDLAAIPEIADAADVVLAPASAEPAPADDAAIDIDEIPDLFSSGGDAAVADTAEEEVPELESDQVALDIDLAVAAGARRRILIAGVTALVLLGAGTAWWLGVPGRAPAPAAGQVVAPAATPPTAAGPEQRPVVATVPASEAPGAATNARSAAAAQPVEPPPEPAPPRTIHDRLAVGGQAPIMVGFEAASFTMGSPVHSMHFDERPQRTVRLGAFAFSRYEVTVREYRRFLRATGRSAPAKIGRKQDAPVVNVSWNEAVAYAAWLSRQTGHSYRLPSEAEWEYAASGGVDSIYWWGDEVGRNRANCFGCGSSWDAVGPAPVGSFEANPFGIHDSAGNVMEWVQDCYQQNYRAAPQDGRAHEDGACAVRAVRGAAYNTPTDNLRVTKRSKYHADTRLPNIGIRMVRDY